LDPADIAPRYRPICEAVYAAYQNAKDKTVEVRSINGR
jgi:hypothetical protein